VNELERNCPEKPIAALSIMIFFANKKVINQRTVGQCHQTFFCLAKSLAKKVAVQFRHQLKPKFQAKIGTLYVKFV